MVVGATPREHGTGLNRGAAGSAEGAAVGYAEGGELRAEPGALLGAGRHQGTARCCRRWWNRRCRRGSCRSAGRASLRLGVACPSCPLRGAVHAVGKVHREEGLYQALPPHSALPELVKYSLRLGSPQQDGPPGEAVCALHAQGGQRVDQGLLGPAVDSMRSRVGRHLRQHVREGSGAIHKGRHSARGSALRRRQVDPSVDFEVQRHLHEGDVEGGPPFFRRRQGGATPGRASTRTSLRSGGACRPQSSGAAAAARGAAPRSARQAPQGPIPRGNPQGQDQDQAVVGHGRRVPDPSWPVGWRPSCFGRQRRRQRAAPHWRHRPRP